VGDSCDLVVQEVTALHSELVRLQSDSEQVSSHTRTTVDQRDDLLLNLQALVGKAEEDAESHFTNRDQLLCEI